MVRKRGVDWLHFKAESVLEESLNCFLDQGKIALTRILLNLNRACCHLINSDLSRFFALGFS